MAQICLCVESPIMYSHLFSRAQYADSAIDLAFAQPPL